MPLIEIKGLSKSFGATPVVTDVDWHVDAGSIAGLVGPNGAGKTTILKLLLGITRPSAGSATVLGRDVITDSVGVRADVAFVPEDKLLYDEMPAQAFLRFYASYFPGWDGEVARRLLDAWSVPTTPCIKALSKGMRAKLVLAAAVARQPRLMLLDEPTIDLDPASREEILSMLARWVTYGERAVVVTTHRLEEVERICDHVLLMEDGKALLAGDLDDIRSDWKRLVGVGPRAAEQAVASWKGVRTVTTTGDITTLVVTGDHEAVVQRWRDAGAEQVEVQDMNLRDVYLTVTRYTRGRLDDVLEGLG